MNRKTYILFFIIPSLRGLSAFFRFKDLDDIGIDDTIADQIDALVVSLEKWANDPTSK